MSGSARSLRPRSSRPSYAQYVDENVEDGGSSSDEFEPDKEAEVNEEEDSEEDSDADSEDAEDNNGVGLPPHPTFDLRNRSHSYRYI